jgi:hypothetical protein
VGSFSFPLPNFYFPISNFYLQGRAKLACGEGLQGAQPRIEFRGREAAVAVESAQKIRGRLVTLARVAFDTAGNQVAVGMTSAAGAWDDVVEALYMGGRAAEAVKADAAFAIVNSFAERTSFQEIRGFDRRGRRLSRVPRGAVFAWADRADIRRGKLD